MQSATNPEQFSYDNLGNRTSNNAQFDQANRITEDATYRYRYDIRGNRTQKVHKNTGVVEQYSYNTLNQLVEYKKLASSTATTPQIHYAYLYDAMGRRIGKADKLNSTVTAFQWLGSQMVSEQTQGQSKTNYVLDGSLTPVAAMQDNTQYDYYKDHLGTVHNVTDSNGGTVWSGNYSTFGQVQETSNGHLHNLRFAGQYHDRESGLYYNFYRDYDPILGRYVQSDPIGLVAGLNTYAYVGGNPVGFVDPLGESWAAGAGRVVVTVAGVSWAGYQGYQAGEKYSERRCQIINDANNRDPETSTPSHDVSDSFKHAGNSVATYGPYVAKAVIGVGVALAGGSIQGAGMSVAAGVVGVQIGKNTCTCE